MLHQLPAIYKDMHFAVITEVWFRWLVGGLVGWFSQFCKSKKKKKKEKGTDVFVYVGKKRKRKKSVFTDVVIK